MTLTLYFLTVEGAPRYLISSAALTRLQAMDNPLYAEYEARLADYREYVTTREYTLNLLSYGERNEVLRQATVFTSGVRELDAGLCDELLLAKITGLGLEEVRALPERTAEVLWEEYTLLKSPPLALMPLLEPPSATGANKPGSPSTTPTSTEAASPLK